MVAIASRARALSTVAAAGGVLIAALALTPRTAPEAGCPIAAREHADDGMRLAARWQGQATGDHLVVTITAPEAGSAVRPPLSVAIVIDRSKSMSGEPIAHAKAAAARLVLQLDAGDAFAVIAYSDDEATIVPLMRATAANKELAARAIAELAVDNGTCISCGLARAGEGLARTPIEGGVRRMVLISDGYANLGLRDRDELVQLAADTAARGISISAVGVGLEFDEQTMMRIAEVGRGNYHYVEDTGRLDAAFDREVSGLAATVATDVRLAVHAPGVRIEQALGYPMTAAGGMVSIPIADLRAGETRRVVLRVSGAGAQPPCGPIARLSWRRALDGAGRSAVAATGPADAEDALALDMALAAAALDRAADRAATEGPAAAQRDLDAYRAEVRNHPRWDWRMAGMIHAPLTEATGALADAAGGGDTARAIKLTRSLARLLTH
jgi:hypothetical protein